MLTPDRASYSNSDDDFVFEDVLPESTLSRVEFQRDPPCPPPTPSRCMRPTCMPPPSPRTPSPRTPSTRTPRAKRPDTPRYGRVAPTIPVVKPAELPLASVLQKENATKLHEAQFTEEDATTSETRHRLKEIQWQKAEDLYKHFLWEQVGVGIQHIRKSKIPLTSVRLLAVEAKITKARFGKIPVHCLHYGNHGSTRHWCDRRPHSGQSAFLTVSKEVFARGYYLLDESDPSKSHQIHIRLHCEEPLDYNIRKQLWHGMNW